jgi:hypothetical protein
MNLLKYTWRNSYASDLNNFTSRTLMPDRPNITHGLTGKKLMHWFGFSTAFLFLITWPAAPTGAMIIAEGRPSQRYGSRGHGTCSL